VTSDRSLLLTLLHNYHPTEQEEQMHRELVLSFVQEEELCFERSLEKGHITASAWIVNKANTHALLMHHRKLHLWCQLGGHCDGDHDVLRVALREAKEESGICHIEPLLLGIFDVDVHAIPPYQNIPEHKHYDIRFLLQVQSNETGQKNEESEALLWVDKETSSLPTTETSILRLHAKWKKLFPPTTTSPTL